MHTQVKNILESGNSETLNFYSNKTQAIILFLISSFFVFAGILLRERLFHFETHPFKSSALVLGLFMFTCGAIFSILLIFRSKPLLTISENQITIYNVIYKKRIVNINDIESVFSVNTYHRGIVTNRHIYIELKTPSERYRKTWFYKLLHIFSKRIANSQYGIQTDFLNINQQNLLKIIEEKIEASFQRSK